MALLFLLLLLLFHSSPTTADPLTKLCETKGNYTNNSTYQSNLNLLLTSLSSSNRTFSTDSEGSIPDRAYGLSLCRGDINSIDCSTCLHNAAQDILSLCPNYKQASIWYDNCQLRYSDMSFFSSVDNSIVHTFNDPENETDPDTFGKMAMDLIDKLFNIAAYNSSLMFTTGRLLYRTDLPAIYGMVQCTRDLTGPGCSDCFAQIRVHLRGCCYGKRGVRVVGRSCYLRYEVYSFFEGEPNISLSLPVTSGVITSGGTKTSTKKVLAIVIPSLVSLVFIIILFILFCTRRSRKKIPNLTKLEEFASIQSLLFDLSVLKVATANFSDVNKLGQGAFGTVYKGTLPNGQEIAVKRLSANSKQGLGELKNELVLVAKLQHRNLVRLRGLCLEEVEKLLIYEYVPNRSLDTILFDPSRRRQLNWERRFNIILGIARGLRYLHEESQLKVIHRDLKASNVLLDADMNPKISDFGLARHFGEDETHGMTSRVVGTFGYMAPEYALHGQFSIKLDVFSFGVLVLEIVTGKKNTSFRDSQTESANDLLSYTWEHWNNGTTTEIIDPSMGENYSGNEVVRCIQIGLLCAQEFPADRPPMSVVILKLNSSSMTLPTPLQPAFCGPMSIIDPERTPRQYGLDFDDWLALQSRTTSPNEDSNSDFEPR